MIKSLEENKIAGAALDVFDKEPLDEGRPFRKLKNVLATPHIGFVTQDTYTFAMLAFLTIIVGKDKGI